MFKIADTRDPLSLASKFRSSRVQYFRYLFQIDETTRILDVGGTVEFWQNAGMGGDINIMNIIPPSANLPKNFHFVHGDACDLSRYHDAEFDVIFSNSVIEHVGGSDEKIAMAREIRRVGKSYFVQTPNRNFPIEPHFIYPIFQFLPVVLRLFIAKHWPYGWYEPGSCQALNDAKHLRLITCSELSYLFPDSYILGESLWLFNKSLIAIRSNRAFITYPGFRILRQPVLTEKNTLS